MKKQNVPKHVVIECINTQNSIAKTGLQVDKDEGIVDSAEVGDSTGLVLSREQSKAKRVDETSRNGGP
jgi:hypothetical protein